MLSLSAATPPPRITVTVCGERANLLHSRMNSHIGFLVPGVIAEHMHICAKLMDSSVIHIHVHMYVYMHMHVTTILHRDPEFERGITGKGEGEETKTGN